MSRYRVTGIAQVEVVTFVEASDYKEAEKIASKRRFFDKKSLKKYGLF